MGTVDDADGTKIESASENKEDTELSGTRISFRSWFIAVSI